MAISYRRQLEIHLSDVREDRSLCSILFNQSAQPLDKEFEWTVPAHYLPKRGALRGREECIHQKRKKAPSTRRNQGKKDHLRKEKSPM